MHAAVVRIGVDGDGNPLLVFGGRDGGLGDGGRVGELPDAGGRGAREGWIGGGEGGGEEESESGEDEGVGGGAHCGWDGAGAVMEDA